MAHREASKQQIDAVLERIKRIHRERVSSRRRSSRVDVDSYDSDNPCPADLGELVDQALDMMCSRPDFKPGRILDQLEYHGDRSLDGNRWGAWFLMAEHPASPGQFIPFGSLALYNGRIICTFRDWELPRPPAFIRGARRAPDGGPSDDGTETVTSDDTYGESTLGGSSYGGASPGYSEGGFGRASPPYGNYGRASPEYGGSGYGRRSPSTRPSSPGFGFSSQPSSPGIGSSGRRPHGNHRGGRRPRHSGGGGGGGYGHGGYGSYDDEL